jgi:hypothetical protein
METELGLAQKRDLKSRREKKIGKYTPLIGSQG